MQQNRATDSKKTRQKVKEDNDRILVEGEPNGTSMEVDQNPNPVGAPMQDDPIFHPVVPYPWENIWRYDALSYQDLLRYFRGKCISAVVIKIASTIIKLVCCRCSKLPITSKFRLRKERSLLSHEENNERYLK